MADMKKVYDDLIIINQYKWNHVPKEILNWFLKNQGQHFAI